MGGATRCDGQVPPSSPAGGPQGAAVWADAGHQTRDQTSAGGEDMGAVSVHDSVSKDATC